MSLNLPAGLIPHPRSTKDDRTHSLGGTDARVIASGDWLELWEQKIGKRAAPDLSRVWKPQLGLLTEPLHAKFHGYQTGDVVNPLPDAPLTTKKAFEEMPFVHVTLDYHILGEGFLPLELKHTNERNDLRGCATYYMAQLQWQMMVTGVDALRFSIIRGNNEPEWGLVERDADYIATLYGQAKAFWWCVENKVAPESVSTEAPAALGKMAAGVKIDGLKPYDMAASNEWVATAGDYIAQKKASDLFKETDKKLRGLIPSDASEVKGGGLSFKRDARGAYRVTIHE